MVVTVRTKGETIGFSYADVTKIEALDHGKIRIEYVDGASFCDLEGNDITIEPDSVINN